MKHKNKYMPHLNRNAIFIHIGIFLALGMLGLTTVIQFIDGKIARAVCCIILGSLTGFCYILLLWRGVHFKTNFVRLPMTKNGVVARGKIDIEYSQIAGIEVCLRGQSGLHINAMILDGVMLKLGEVETLVITDKQGNKHLLSLQYYSKKQIDYIVNEISCRAGINN